MKIRTHSELHLVELEDGSQWQIFPGDLDLTLHWEPETDLTVVAVSDVITTHMLAGADRTVRVVRAGQSWPVGKVREVLREG
jgi:hypothetical protein